MKLIYGNGKVVEVRDVGPVVFRLLAGSVPIKVNGYRIASDDEARDLIRDLLRTKLYKRGDI